MLIEPLLSAPPAFVLLAVVVGISGYLREVSKNREKEIDDIEERKCASKFPPGSPQRKKRLDDLESSRKRLTFVATCMIALVILIAARLLAIAIMRAVNRSDPLWLDVAYRVADLVIMALLFALFISLGWMHHIGRQKNNEIRVMVKTWRAAQESTARPAARVSGKTRKAATDKTILEIPESGS